MSLLGDKFTATFLCTVKLLTDWLWILCCVQLSLCMTGRVVCSVIKIYRWCIIIRSPSDILSQSLMASAHVPQLSLKQVSVADCKVAKLRIGLELSLQREHGIWSHVCREGMASEAVFVERAGLLKRLKGTASSKLLHVAMCDLQEL